MKTLSRWKYRVESTSPRRHIRPATLCNTLADVSEYKKRHAIELGGSNIRHVVTKLSEVSL